MQTLKKAGILSAATSLAAGVMFVGAASFASAAPVTITATTLNIGPDGSSDVTIGGCIVGAELTIDSPVLYGEDPETQIVDEGWLPATQTFEYEMAFGEGGEQLFVDLPITVTCTPPEGVEEESTAGLTLNFYGDTWLVTEPDPFVTGEAVTLTAGDFLPGEEVTLNVYSEESDVPVLTQPFGTAGADFSVSGTVVFPTELEPGAYPVELSAESGTLRSGVLTIDPDATPTPTPTEAPTVAPTVTPTVTPTPTVIPTATAAPTSRPQPGLPSTGN